MDHIIHIVLIMEYVSISYLWCKIKFDVSGFYGRCFSGDSLVKLSNGEDKRIDSINIGDQILTIDQSKLISTDVIMILDKHSSKKGIYF